MWDSDLKGPHTARKFLSGLSFPFVLSELKRLFRWDLSSLFPFSNRYGCSQCAAAMGMFMLKIVSLPFKILLFVLVDGWHLVVQSLVESFA